MAVRLPKGAHSRSRPSTPPPKRVRPEPVEGRPSASACSRPRPSAFVLSLFVLSLSKGAHSRSRPSTFVLSLSKGAHSRSRPSTFVLSLSKGAHSRFRPSTFVLSLSKGAHSRFRPSTFVLSLSKGTHSCFRILAINPQPRRLPTIARSCPLRQGLSIVPKCHCERSVAIS